MCAVSDCAMDTQRLSFPSTAVAARKAKALYQSHNVKNDCAAKAQSRDLNCKLKKQLLQSGLTFFAVNSIKESVPRKRSAVCAVWVFSRMSAYGGPSESNCGPERIVDVSLHCHDLSHQELVHLPFH